MRYIFIVLLVFFLDSSSTGHKTEESAEKMVVDDDTTTNTAGKNSEWSDVEFIPRDQLCLLCHSVIAKFKQANLKSPEQFKNDLLTSCALLKEPSEIKKCRDGITDDQLAKLNTTSVSDICVSQRLCKEKETVDFNQFSDSNRNVDDQFEAIPDVEDAAEAHSSDPKGFKTFEKAQDMIQNAYA